jgi:hypothetical protein
MKMHGTVLEKNIYRYFGLVCPNVSNNSANPKGYTQTSHTGTHSVIHFSSSISKGQIRFQYKTDLSSVAYKMAFIS